MQRVCAQSVECRCFTTVKLLTLGRLASGLDAHKLWCGSDGKGRRACILVSMEMAVRDPGSKERGERACVAKDSSGVATEGVGGGLSNVNRWGVSRSNRPREPECVRSPLRWACPQDAAGWMARFKSGEKTWDSPISVNETSSARWQKTESSTTTMGKGQVKDVAEP
jgi:hypothetical protein